jgi:hypothetical protein
MLCPLDYIEVDYKLYCLQRVKKKDIKIHIRQQCKNKHWQQSIHYNLNKIGFTFMQMVLSLRSMEIQEYEFNENCLAIYHSDDTTCTLTES